MVDQRRLLEQLELHEGLRERVYRDTLGNDTLGIGYNVTARGLEDFERTIGRPITATGVTPEEARRQCVADIQRIERAVLVHFPEYSRLNEVRQRVVVDLAFNLGLGALAFRQTRAAVEAGDWSRAARELYKSRWAYQVDDGPGRRFGRADRLVKMLLTGADFVS